MKKRNFVSMMAFAASVALMVCSSGEGISQGKGQELEENQGASVPCIWKIRNAARP